LRRSCVSGGIGSLTISLSDTGLMPRSLARMALSMTAIIVFSHGLTVMSRASTTCTVAT
jgi:hypothetical protein